MRGPLFIAGPTASGKSAAALELALRLGGEIISVDSMQVYRGLDIGTAKPCPAERARVPHHLIDIADPAEEFDAARFVRLAEAAETQILARGRIPIYCGGTGLYFSALASGLGDAPASSPGLRQELENTPREVLLREIEQRDPQLYARIDRSNPRRILRAVAVLRATGSTFSELRADWSAAPRRGSWFGLERDRTDLYQRINHRVDAMFASGLIEETHALLERATLSNRGALQAIGYRQVIEHLEGKRPLPETIALIKQKTRHYAKRQLTWFRHKLDLQWLPVPPSASPSSLAAQIEAQLSK